MNDIRSGKNSDNTNLVVVKGATVTFAGMIFQLVMSFVSGIIITRVIGPAEYGIFSIARTLCESLTIFTKAGFDIGIVRYFGENTGLDNAEGNARFLQLVLATVLCLSLVPVIAVCFGGGLLLKRYVYQYQDFNLVMMVMVLSVPFMTLIQVLGGAFRGSLQIRPRVVAELFMQPTVRLAIIILLFLVGWRIWAAITGTVLSFVIATVYLIIIANHAFFNKGGGNKNHTRRKLPWRDLVIVGKYSMVISLTVAVSTLLAKTDIIMLGYFSSSEQVGQYAVIQMVVVLIGLFNGALNQAVAPLFAQLYKNGDREEMRRIIHQHTRWVVITSVPIFLIIACFGNQFMSIFGKGFVVETSAIALLALSQLVIAVLSSAGFMLSMTGRHMLEFYTMLAALICNVVLNYILIPKFGIVGASIGTLTAVILANVLRSLQVYKVHGVFPVGKEVVWPLLIGMGSFTGTLSVARYFGIGNGLSQTIIVSTIFIIVYSLLVIKFGLVKNDRFLFQKVVQKFGFQQVIQS